MVKYTKVISLKGTYYTREHTKIKKHKSKVREIDERIVSKSFKEMK